MRRGWPVFLLLAAIGCTTIGVSREGYAVIKPSVAQLMLLDYRQLVVFDFRDNSEYWGPDGHIAGALSTPLGTIDTRLPELIPYQNTTVLVYAQDTEEGIRGARVLSAAGFSNVVVIEDGIQGWLRGGFKTVTSQ
jgi:rhodanese-related sulfurtransferase